MEIETRTASLDQTKLGSLIEAGMNIMIGYGVALLSQLALFPAFDIHVSLSTNLWIGLWFTAISLVRSYIIRRWFNARLRAAAQAMAGGGGNQ
ncbi:hypothetical protein [Nitrosomonas sp.]|uniref:DUF7220 family protein n=1 Tax=Nitrosomonas sp. TaxID=42353 RepID=UPI0037C512DF